MSRSSRRTFLKQAAVGSAVLSWGASARAAGSGEKIIMGAIGCGGQGMHVLRSFAAQPDVSMAYVCDPDSQRADKAAAEVEKLASKRPQAVGDLRRVLDDKSVDAVIVATPDHWHAPATILACKAGKHVYVEKPCSHNLREGRLMVEAARRHQRVIQTGTQGRSLPHVLKAIRLLYEGAIGQVLVTKAFCCQMRANIGHKAPAAPPAGLDYDLWVGPAPFVQWRPNCHHYTWRWWHNFGTGEIGNDGVHELDLARWALGVETHPSTVACAGGKYFFDDDQQFPDTYYVTYEYPGDGKLGSRRQLIFELRDWCDYRMDGFENGNEFYGTKGMMVLGKEGGWKLYGRQSKLLDQMESGPFDSTPHHRNFLACIRSGERPAADVEIGHLSASLAHLGNIAARVGRALRFDPQAEHIVGDQEADRLLRRAYREGHWAVPEGA